MSEIRSQTHKKLDDLAIDIESIVESLIFVSPDPVGPEHLHKTLSGLNIEISLKDLKVLLENLLAAWQREDRSFGRGICLRKMGDGYLFTTEPKNAFAISKMVLERPTSLSKAQVEVLAIVAYRQPIARQDIDQVRGVDSGAALKKLIEYNLVKILGKSEGLGRPLLYGTSSYFLEFFSMTSLKDLPELKQYEALGDGDIDSLSEKISPMVLRDLFADDEEAMHSKKVLSLSEEALKSLDDALMSLDLIKTI